MKQVSGHHSPRTVIDHQQLRGVTSRHPEWFRCFTLRFKVIKNGVLVRPGEIRNEGEGSAIQTAREVTSAELSR